MLNSIIATILALLAATFGIHHAPVATTSISLAPSAHTRSAQLAAAATPQTPTSTTQQFQDLSSAGNSTSGISSDSVSTSSNSSPDSLNNTTPQLSYLSSQQNQKQTSAAPPSAVQLNPLARTNQKPVPNIRDLVKTNYITVSDLDQKLQTLDAKLRGEIAAATSSAPSQAALDALWHALSLTNRVQTLSSVTLTNPTITGGVTGLTAADIPTISLASAVSGTLPAGSGGTGTTTWQTGSIPFFNGTNLTENNSNLFWDNTNSRLGIGTSTPDQKLSIFSNTTPSLEWTALSGAAAWTAGIDTADGYKFKIASSTAVGTNPRLTIDGNGNVGIGTTNPSQKFVISSDRAIEQINTYETGGFSWSTLQLRKAGGTEASPLPVASGDTLGAFTFMGAYDNGSGVGTFPGVATAGVFAKAAEAYSSSGNLGSYFTFETTPDGSATRAERMRITASGNVGIGTTTPNGILSVNTTTYPKDLILANATGNTSQFQVRARSGDGEIFLTLNSAAGVQGVLLVPDSNSFVNAAGGNFGIGTTTPYSRLTVWGPDTSGSTAAFLVANSASTTEFSVFDDGNATLAGTLTQNSDARLKSNVQPLDASSSLAAIEALNPVSYQWAGNIFGSGQQLGFIAQDVQKFFPQLVSTTSPTALTPDGTLGLNYSGLIAPIISAIKVLAAELDNLVNTVAGFAESFTTKELTFDRATGNELTVKKLNAQQLCIGTTCITEAQLAAVLAGVGQTGTAPSSSGQAAGAAPSDAASNVASSTPDQPATTTPPAPDTQSPEPASTSSAPAAADPTPSPAEQGTTPAADSGTATTTP